MPRRTRGLVCGAVLAAAALTTAVAAAGAPPTKEPQPPVHATFPAGIQAVTTFGQTQHLVLVPGQFRPTPGLATPGRGTERLFTKIGTSVYYGRPDDTDKLAPEIIRLNDELLGKMATAPSLKPEQQALMKKLYRDQVKSRGGFDAIKLTLEDAGAPFSAEQIAQIEPLLKDSRGPETMARIIKLLTPGQRAALR